MDERELLEAIDAGHVSGHPDTAVEALRRRGLVKAEYDGGSTVEEWMLTRLGAQVLGRYRAG